MTYSLPKVISTSQINTYRHCPYQYFLRYVLKIQTDIKSPELERGSRIHSNISNRIFESDDPLENDMLSRAKAILDMYPPNPILETTHEDPNNPGRFFGNVLGKRAIGIFDFHWANIPFAGDWKTGNFYEEYTESFEIQAFILDELYNNKYDKHLKGFSFEFLKSGKLYNAKSIAESETKSDIKELIHEAFENIDSGQFDRNKGILCKWCNLIEYCKKDFNLDAWLI
jgi:hypothetical protein